MSHFNMKCEQLFCLLALSEGQHVFEAVCHTMIIIAAHTSVAPNPVVGFGLMVPKT